jgi:hypothetical protein
MDEFLYTYHQSKLNQEDINHTNRSITQNAATKSLPEKKSSVSAEFCQTFKEEQIPNFFTLFHEIQREGKLPNSFYDASITLIPKPDKTPPNGDL